MQLAVLLLAQECWWQLEVAAVAALSVSWPVLHWVWRLPLKPLPRAHLDFGGASILFCFLCLHLVEKLLLWAPALKLRQPCCWRTLCCWKSLMNRWWEIDAPTTTKEKKRDKKADYCYSFVALFEIQRLLKSENENPEKGEESTQTRGKFEKRCEEEKKKKRSGKCITGLLILLPPYERARSQAQDLACEFAAWVIVAKMVRAGGMAVNPQILQPRVRVVNFLCTPTAPF